MYLKDVISKSVHGLRVGAVSLSALQLTLGSAWASPFQSAEDSSTRTPIKHVIVIIGENRTFDHIFATYKPKKGETVDNLLSKEIIREDNSPGPNFSRAVQYSAVDTHSDKYQVSPMDKSLYETLPPPLVGGPKTPNFSTIADAKAAENGLPEDYYKLLTTGGTGQTSRTPDQRIPNVNDLPPGPFQLTSPSLPYDAYAASPVHRFYQMWQQLDCNARRHWHSTTCFRGMLPT
jgi:phospholipase C